MNRDDVIRMARESQVIGHHAHVQYADLERFALLVAQHEREECAQAVERVSKFQAYTNNHSVQEHCAAAIRARSAD